MTSARSDGRKFLDATLNGAGQVIFQESRLSGLLFLGAVAWGSIAAKRVEVWLASMLALLVATGVARLFRVNEKSWSSGLYGYNALLVGAALATFLKPTPLAWVAIVLAAVASVAVTLAFHRATSTPALTAPFIITVWLVLLAAHQWSALSLEQTPSAVRAAPSLTDCAAATFKGLSQIFLLDSLPAGLLVLMGLAVTSRRAALLALAGAGAGLMTALAYGASSAALSGGLYGFSPALTALALGATFRSASRHTVLIALLGAVLTALVQAALNELGSRLGTPALTAPFVLVTWVALLAQPKPASR